MGKRRCDAHAVAAPRTVRFLSLSARTASLKVLPVVTTSSIMIMGVTLKKSGATSKAPERLDSRCD